MNDHLRLISVFHYVVGGLMMFFCSFPLIHFFVGLGLLIAPTKFENVHGDDILPLQIMGGFFMVMASIFLLLGWSMGICTILSGRYIAQRRRRTFSIAMAAINCMHFPFGTTLGVFTLILLTKDEAKILYGEPVNPPLMPPTPPPPATPGAFPPSPGT
jgi:hypothetical protein